ncbi:permease [Pseudonocardia hydrocarbonoxydans]|uniref:Permease n=1 Tax=Pseudonocardia hydrocarbonoxydans TaxID=76726 RepID=A0A4Y3WQW4_9PSEU|nr:permease [Pseudonocardia hydrocarbonoxydans]
MPVVTITARAPRITSLHVFCAVLVLAILARPLITEAASAPALRTAATVFVAVCVQALPFLVFGVLLSGVIAAFVSPAALRRMLPAHPGAAVPVAGAAGLVLPGCECASVPVARRLIGQGVPDAAALTFLLAAPAVNPIVLVATAVAFPGEPRMVLARFLGSLATACVMGWLWQRAGRAEWIADRARRGTPRRDGENRWAVLAETARHDLVSAGGFLVLGAVAAAALSVLVPPEWMDALAGQLLLAIVVMAVLAVVLALCSEADAFVAASLSMLPLLPRLVFLVVGPAVDVKLIALQAGTFGRAFAARFAPATFVVAILCACAAGALVL